MGQTEDQKVKTAVSKSYGYMVESGIKMSSASNIKKKSTSWFNLQIPHINSVDLIRIPWNLSNYHSKQMSKGQTSASFTFRHSLWSSMTMSLRLLILFVISSMAQLVAASNGSTRSGGVGVSGSIPSMSNAIPKGGPYKSAQSAASVSNIVNGHYQPINEDGKSSSIAIMADSTGHHHFSATIDDTDDNYWREVKAIIGGVLGFWGGIGSLGTLFLIVVMSKRYCCRDVDDKDSDKDG